MHLKNLSGFLKRRFAKGGQGIGVGLRMSLFYTFYFTLFAYLLFALAYFYLYRSTAFAEMDAVGRQIEEFRKIFREAGPDAVQLSFIEQKRNHPEDWFLRFNSANRSFILYSHLTTETRISQDGIRNLDILKNGSHLRLGTGRHSSWTVATVEVAPGELLQIGRSNSGGEAVLLRFRHIFILASVPILVLGLLSGLLINHYSLQPIRKLGKTIREILATGDLDQRVAIETQSSEFSPICEGFNNLLDQNQRLIAAMGRSLDDLSHDLRTPLSRLRATLEQAIVPGDKSPASEACREGIEECDEFVDLLRSIMETREAESGAMRLDMETLDLGEIMERVIDLYEFVAEERGIVFETDLTPGLQIYGDRPRLLRLFSNLVDNAVKHSPDQGKIQIESSMGTPGFARIKIGDRGPGIPLAEQSRIWDRLYRGDQSRSTSGLGLGLSYVKAIAEAHGGKASVISQPGNGSVFIVDLPVEKSSP